MATLHPYLNLGGKTIDFRLPESWRLLTVAGDRAGPPAARVDRLVAAALESPVGTPPLADCVTPTDRIAVMVEDTTRPAPKALVLEAVLAELSGAGVPDDHVCVVVALGTHRPLSRSEMTAAYGPSVCRRCRVVNHDCRAGDLVTVGRLESGRPVRVNRHVAEADFRIGVGSILPHPLNGFGGGSKILFPGVADVDSIRAHHCRLSFAAGTRPGRLDGNPFYRQAASACTDIRVDFLVDCVVDAADRVGAVVAGDAAGAFARGVAASRRLLSRRFPGKSEVTIVSTYPYSDGTQFIKTVAPAAAVTVPGGCILMVVDGADPLPEAFVAAFARCRRERGGKDPLDGVMDRFASGCLAAPDAAVDFNMALAYTLAMQSRFDIVLCSDAIPAEQSRRMGFAPAAALTDAIARAAAGRPAATANVIPAGGLLLPVVDGGG
jgi:nickel-dependent lactate racemase